MSKIIEKPQNPKTITTDWVQISLTGHIPQQKKGVRRLENGWVLRYYGRGHGFWRSMVDVYKNGQKIAKIDCHPSSVMPPDRVILFVNNRLQYEKGWTLKIKEFINIMNLKFNHIGRLDIAIDMPSKNGFAFIEKVGARKWRPTGGAYFDMKMQHGRFLWARYGTPKSGKSLKFYYKRQEILNVSNKHYIEEFWKANFFNLQDQEEVERYELTLKRDELKSYVAMTDQDGVIIEDGQINMANLSRLEDPDFLSTLYRTATDGYLEFVSTKQLEKTGNVSRCKRFQIMDFRGFAANLLYKVKSKATNTLYAFKMSIKQLYQCHLKTGSEIYLHLAKEMTKNCNLDRWFIGNESKWYKDFLLKYKSSEFEYLTNYELEAEGQLRVVKIGAYI